MGIHWQRSLALICVLGAGSLSSCDSQKQPASLSYEDALAKVRQKIPAESYFSEAMDSRRSGCRPMSGTTRLRSWLNMV